VAGRQSPPGEIAPLAPRSAQRQIPVRIAAGEGPRLTEHHRQRIRYSRQHGRFLEEPPSGVGPTDPGEDPSSRISAARGTAPTIAAIQTNRASRVQAETGPASLESIGIREEPELVGWGGSWPSP
jgi:hypothetical protein